MLEDESSCLNLSILYLNSTIISGVKFVKSSTALYLAVFPGYSFMLYFRMIVQYSPMIVKSIRNILLKVRLYHSKPDHCGIRASVIDTLKPMSIRVKI